MNIVVEFLDKEPIENVITAIRFDVDKVIFFGYEEIIKEYEEQTRDFLKEKCGINLIKFHRVSEKNMNNVLNCMKKVLDEEKKPENRIFFDLTGGESLVLVAFGMLSKTYDAQMHMYDIEEDKLIELEPENDARISNSVKQRNVDLTLDNYIEMRGAKINHELDKGHINVNDKEFMACARKLWALMVKYKNKWNHYTGIIQRNFKTQTMSVSCILTEDVTDNFREFRTFMSDLSAAGIIVDYDPIELKKVGNKKRVEFSFSYRSLALKDCLMKSGTTLELHVYDEMKKKSTHCMESVHIDWDGEIFKDTKKDVVNEIDVFAITGNVPTIISCKGGNMSGDDMRDAMYELETVANHFGGKYAKKVFATLHPVTGVFEKRAKEMGIELWCCE